MPTTLRRLVLPLVVSAVMAPSTVGAQLRSGIAVGTPVRVHVSPPDEWWQGTLVRADSLSVVLRTGGLSLSGQQLVTIRRANVRAVEVRRGRTGVGKRTFVGALLGAAAAIGLAAAGMEGLEAPGAGLVILPLAGVGGGVVGAVLGRKTAPHRWEPASLPLRVAAAHDGRARLAHSRTMTPLPARDVEAEAGMP